ncbi:superoxide dismutase family protein [Shimazuella alba]|uniref:Superoxide dismutase [Cu-Zn] n=1 Tax=Shimazuella alba TaxID=2690964 RepID=A0A6I4VRA5_9BACL|nr:superoxide dismutase family protein [Shimazuella alba]MXQ52951.1 superoxide dismutase family protein [Shimazuella alba]
MKYSLLLAIFVASTTLVGCSDAAKSKEAVAQMMDSKGMNVGTIQLTESQDGVHMKMNVKNLPVGAHAFHIHTVGKCTAPDFKSAGPHFNPTDKEHGHLNPKGSHAGDLGNITVKSDGTFTLTKTIAGVTLEKGQKNSLFQTGGTAFVIHEKPDDEKSNPAGNAGSRIVCGVVK